MNAAALDPSGKYVCIVEEGKENIILRRTDDFEEVHILPTPVPADEEEEKMIGSPRSATWISDNLLVVVSFYDEECTSVHFHSIERHDDVWFNSSNISNHLLHIVDFQSLLIFSFSLQLSRIGFIQKGRERQGFPRWILSCPADWSGGFLCCRAHSRMGHYRVLFVL
jgi:hypothetical protein